MTGTPTVIDPVSGQTCIASEWDNTTPGNNTAPTPNGAPSGMFGNQVEPTFRTIMTAVAQVLGLASSAYNNTGSLLTALGAVRGVSSGMIVLWNGQVNQIPAGWVLCDGTNGSPDLRGLFVVGAGGSLGPGVTGGSTSSSAQTDAQGSHNHGGNTAQTSFGAINTTTDTQGAHSHTGNTQGYALQVADLAPHQHTFQLASTNSGGSTAIAATATTGSAAAPVTSTGSGNAHAHGISSDGSHQHNVSVTPPTHGHGISADGVHQHNVTVATVPPYRALCYIMKT
jgi:hypothetical protein